MPPKKNLLDLIESYYLIHFLRHLCHTNVIDPGRSNLSPNRKSPFINEMLEFISDRTDIVQKKKSGYSLSPSYKGYTNLAYHIDKLVDSYGNFDFNNPRRLLQLNKPAFASAKEKTMPYYDYALINAVLDQVEGNHILDLGCGMGGLMLSYCLGNTASRKATGIDNNKGLCTRGNRLFQQEGLKKKARIYYGNVLEIGEAIPEKALEDVNIVVANNFMNELFGAGKNKPFEGLLKVLKQKFPGRYLVIMDYYGVFGTKRKNDPRLQHNYIHDVMQLFSGQGVPPPDYKSWNQYYKKAGYRLLQVYEGEMTGISWFIHVLAM